MALSRRLLSLAILATSYTAFGVNGEISDGKAFASQKYDYLVVGGGTAGVVVATRLSENPNILVGLIEAGVFHRDDPKIDRPTGFGQPFGDPNYDWLYSSIPQPALNGRVIPEPRGRLLGGSSALNALTWQRGPAEDYDAWANQFGNGPGWSFKSLLPYFKKSENWTVPPLILPGQENPPSFIQSHGTDGPIQVTFNNYYPSSILKAFPAANALGIPNNYSPDLGDPSNVTFASRVIDSKTGKRSYSAPAYYEPNAGRRNLVVLTGALASKVVFSKTGSTPTATGVEYIINGTKYTASAKREVILSAGAFNTPKLLELSGVGNGTLLRKLGIPVVLDLPQVGENLQDHSNIPSEVTVKPGVVTNDDLRWNATFAQEQQTLYNTTLTGALSYTTALYFEIPIQKFVQSADFASLVALFNSSAIPQNALQRVQYNILKENISKGRIWLEWSLVPSGGMVSPPAANTSYLSPIILNYHPLSRGFVHINSSDPAAPPVIDPNFLSNPFDVAINSYGVFFSSKWMQTAPISEDIANQTSPNPDIQTIEEMSTYVRNNIRSTFHPFGSTPMASLNLGGVVDSQLRVYGLKNVRIVDAGIFPGTIGAALTPTVYAVAEKAADIIKSSF